MSKKRIFMAGVGGMLGHAFYRVFNEEYELICTDIDVNEQWISYLDFRDKEQYTKAVVDFKPHYLFHIGAYTDLEFCEHNIEKTIETNTESVKTAVKIANQLSIPLLYISTAGIFDGNKDEYDEDDLPIPLSVYAKTKYEAELYVQENCKQYLICRAGWMMGGGLKKDKKFINKIIKQLLAGKQELFVVNDKDGTPTYTVDFAQNVKVLIEKEVFGLFNLVCSGVTSRYEVASELVKLLGLEQKIKIIPVSSNHFVEEYFAKRPVSERLINKRLNELNLNYMRDWKIALSDYLADYYPTLQFNKTENIN